MSYRAGDLAFGGRPDPHWTCDKCGAIRSCYDSSDFPYRWAMANKAVRTPPGWRRIDGKDFCKECRPGKVTP